MPLSSRARIELYLPDSSKKRHRRALDAFQREFLDTFGGCTVIRDLRGFYLSADGEREKDKIVLLYADTPFDFQQHRSEVTKYADALRETAREATEEESILIVVQEIYHSV